MAPWQWAQQLNRKGSRKRVHCFQAFEEKGFGVEVIIKCKVNDIYLSMS